MKRRFRIRIHPLTLLPLPLLLYLNPLPVLICMAGFTLIHELGHLAVALIQKRQISGFEITPAGAQFILGKNLKSYGADIALHLAGPAANLLAAAGCLVLVRARPEELFFFCFYLNCIFTLFHLLPLQGLDGGAVLYAVLCRKSDPHRAFEICQKVSLATLICLAIALSVSVIVSGFHLSLLFAAAFLILFFFQSVRGGRKKAAV